jgi:HEAT repeat protein
MPNLDAAISKFLDSQRDDDLNSVIAFGHPALYRVLNLYYRSRDQDVAPLRALPAVKGYDAADAWGILVAGVGGEFLNEFLDWVETRGYLGRDPLLIVSMLKGVEDPRARDVLIRYSGHRDRLLRYHAVAGLQWRDDTDSIGVIERRVSDPDPLVKLYARKGVARRDRERGRKLLTEMVADTKVPPMIRKDAESYLSEMSAEGP